MSDITLHPGDNRESLRRLIDNGVRVHSICTDPPYGLVSVQKRFGKSGAAAAKSDNNDGSFARLSGGFMGKAWDGTGIERDPEFWALIWEILLPGGYCFAFSGARTYHWQVCAMEQAGFVIHPMHVWAFGSGLPKAHAADKKIDKYLTGGLLKDDAGEYIPATPEAAQWSGFAYGAQSQKPALEPIALAQKPFETKTGVENLLKHGVGAVNIDGCRVPTTDKLGGGDTSSSSVGKKGNEGWERPWMKDESTREAHAQKRRSNVTKAEALGRHPANLIHDGSPSVSELFPQDSARFFNTFPLTEEDIPSNVPPLFYNQKAGKADRAGSKHPTVKPIALMQHLVRHITPPGGVVLDPFAGTGTTAEAAQREGFDCILMEAEPEYIDFLKERFPGCASADELSIDELLGPDESEITIDALLG